MTDNPPAGRSDELEAIRVLKARYFRLMDTKRWREWGDLFVDDAVFVRDATSLPPIVGREHIVSTVSRLLEGVVSVHHGHMPELTLVGGGRATGIWSMEDFLTTRSGPDAGRVLHGYGHYYERYVKSEQGWRFSSIRLTRLYTSVTAVPHFTPFAGSGELSPGSSIDSDFGA